MKDLEMCPSMIVNLILAKRCFQVRGIHDSETRQKFLSACFVSCGKSTMPSSVSAGRRGFGIVVSVHKLYRLFWRLIDFIYCSCFLARGFPVVFNSTDLVLCMQLNCGDYGVQTKTNYSTMAFPRILSTRELAQTVGRSVV